MERLSDWRTASYSINAGNCVEAASGDRVAVRDTMNRSGAVLRFTPEAWARFTAGLAVR